MGRRLEEVMDTVVRVEFGSHLYGTNTPSSDHDYKQVHIPTAKEIVLQRVKNSTGHKVTRPEGERNTLQDTDDESYSLQRYLELLAQGQTVAIDMLFVPKPLQTSSLWDSIKFYRHRFLTKKSASFVGYCRTQANKYGIRGSRVAASKNATEFFGTLHYGSPNMRYKVGEFANKLPLGEHSQIVTKETTPGRFETYYECCNRLVSFNNTVLEAYNMYKRIYDEYGKRARLAELNEGVDWKALSHAVRVGHEAIELLSTGQVTFPLPNAAHILDIKLGRLPYKKVAEEIEFLLQQVEVHETTSTLREEPDYAFIDELVYEEYASKIMDEY